ncbi:unnamed protein product, partial [Prorocentrum cordatum]
VDPHGLHALGSERSLERRGELDFDDMEWQRILRGAPLGQEGLPVHVPHHGVRVRDGVRDVRTSAGPGAAQGGGGRGGRRGQRVRPRRGGSGRGDRGWSHAGGPAPLLVRAAPEGSGLPLWGVEGSGSWRLEMRGGWAAPFSAADCVSAAWDVIRRHIFKTSRLWARLATRSAERRGVMSTGRAICWRHGSK